jgi:chemotaxis protein MotB
MKNIPLFRLAFSLMMLALALSSCVPVKQLQDMEALKVRCEDELSKLKIEYNVLQGEKNELALLNDKYKDYLTGLQRDTSILGTSLRTMTKNYSQLNETYELLIKKNKLLLDGSDAELIKLQNKLLASQMDVTTKTGSINKLTSENILQKNSIDSLKKELKTALDKLSGTEKELTTKEKKLKELQTILDKQDSIVKALRKTVADAFLGFDNKGLTVKMKNGKVYVSLDENLLFATASTTVDPKGVEALKKLAKVLEQNPDINVLVEGHTDDVAYVPNASGCLKDNWDLSVMRATAIVRIITKNSTVDPKRLTPAGRGPYNPVDPANTASARAKNRRIEIILTPKLDELFKMIESN